MTLELDEIVGGEGLGEKQYEAAEKVADRVLQSKAQCHQRRSDRGHDGGNVNARVGERHHDDYEIEQHLDEGEQKGLDGVVELGLEYQPSQQRKSYADDQEADNDEEREDQQLGY